MKREGWLKERTECCRHWQQVKDLISHLHVIAGRRSTCREGERRKGVREKGEWAVRTCLLFAWLSFFSINSAATHPATGQFSTEVRHLTTERKITLRSATCRSRKSTLADSWLIWLIKNSTLKKKWIPDIQCIPVACIYTLNLFCLVLPSFLYHCICIFLFFFFFFSRLSTTSWTFKCPALLPFLSLTLFPSASSHPALLSSYISLYIYIEGSLTMCCLQEKEPLSLFALRRMSQECNIIKSSNPSTFSCTSIGFPKLSLSLSNSCIHISPSAFNVSNELGAEMHTCATGIGATKVHTGPVVLRQ